MNRSACHLSMINLLLFLICCEGYIYATTIFRSVQAKNVFFTAFSPLAGDLGMGHQFMSAGRNIQQIKRIGLVSSCSSSILLLFRLPFKPDNEQ